MRYWLYATARTGYMPCRWLHLRLYKSGNMSSIDMPWYIRELVEYTRQSFASVEHIRFVMDVDKIELDVVQAIPVGLILNEAIGNAVKHAFADDDNGIVTISVKRLNGDVCELVVADDGGGFPRALMWRSTTHWV